MKPTEIKELYRMLEKLRNELYVDDKPTIERKIGNVQAYIVATNI